MLKLILFLIAAWIAIGIIGLVIKGLFWLFVIGLVLFVITSLFGWTRRGTGTRGGL
ncbi:MAG: hypothetical protein ACRDQA_30735 [Nocardioidaceae bacterium]